jgi:hypothetical protein
MADIDLSTQNLLRSGITPSYTGSLSTGNTYHIVNNGRVFLHFKKTGAGEATITIPTTKTLDGYTVQDQTFAVPASTGDVMAGPFPVGLFSKDLTFTSNEITGLSVAVISMGA